MKSIRTVGASTGGGWLYQREWCILQLAISSKLHLSWVSWMCPRLIFIRINWQLMTPYRQFLWPKIHVIMNWYKGQVSPCHLFLTFLREGEALLVVYIISDMLTADMEGFIFWFMRLRGLAQGILFLNILGNRWTESCEGLLTRSQSWDSYWSPQESAGTLLTPCRPSVLKHLPPYQRTS